MLRESGIPGLYLSWTFRVPPVYLGLPFRRSRRSHGGGLLTAAFRHGAAWRAESALEAPPGCPALELVQVCPQSGDAGLSALVYGCPHRGRRRSSRYQGAR